MIVVVIFHEVSHAFTKFLFNSIITPPGVGPTRGIHGESGWLLEDRFISASWDRANEVGQMGSIKRVVLESKRGSGAAACVIGKTENLSHPKSG
jgi:hypothetical protein